MKLTTFSLPRLSEGHGASVLRIVQSEERLLTASEQADAEAPKVNYIPVLSSHMNLDNNPALWSQFESLLHRTIRSLDCHSTRVYTTVMRSLAGKGTQHA